MNFFVSCFVAFNDNLVFNLLFIAKLLFRMFILSYSVQ